MPLTPEQISAARALFPHTEQGAVYLNHASTAPLSTPVVRAMRRHLEDRSSGKLETYGDDIAMIAELRERIARLIGAESTGRIALQTNTSDAISVVAAGLPWKSGDRILLNRAEFPANVYPFMNVRTHGVEVDFLPAPDGKVTPDDVARAINARTRLVALSAVQFLSGYRADLAAIGEICRRRDVIFAVDGIQAVGAAELDVRGMKIDALAAGCQKWQLGPQGAGFLYLTEELQSRIRQAYLGWLAVEDPWNFFDYEQRPAPGARRYEGGTLAVPCLWGMHAAIQILLDAGMPGVGERLHRLTGRLLEGFARDGLQALTPSGAARRAGIATVRIPEGVDGRALLRELRRRQVTPSVREGCLRFSPHFYNTADDMDRALAETRASLGVLRG